MDNCHLSMAASFVTSHTFCASRVWSKIFNTIFLLIQGCFYAVYDYVEKADLSKGYQNLNRKMWVTMDFSEVIELTHKFRKKFPCILSILKLF